MCVIDVKCGQMIVLNSEQAGEQPSLRQTHHCSGCKKFPVIINPFPKADRVWMNKRESGRVETEVEEDEPVGTLTTNERSGDLF